MEKNIFCSSGLVKTHEKEFQKSNDGLLRLQSSKIQISLVLSAP